jgi:hypothetical protein
MRRFDKTKNMLNANILAEQRYLESKGLIKEGEDCIQVFEGEDINDSLENFKGEIEQAKDANQQNYNAESCLIDDCFDIIFKGGKSLDIVKSKQYFDESSELVSVFNHDNKTNLSPETIYRLIDLFVLENNSDQLSSIIKDVRNSSIKIDACDLYNYISLYNNEDGDILRKIDNKFIERYKDLVSSNRSGLDEGNQQERNNLALEISELSKQIVNAKSRGFNEFVEKLTDELKSKKAKLAELKSVK